jgi:hypothetical protein
MPKRRSRGRLWSENAVSLGNALERTSVTFGVTRTSV